jgi:hypothetical protein
MLNRILQDGTRKLLDIATGAEWTKWSRVVMNREMQNWARELQPGGLDALEISGSFWQDFGFRNYRNTSYPDYDVCLGTVAVEAFNIVIADQVFEHLLWPYRAGKNVYRMLRPRGYFLMSTPFLVRIHDSVDCSRWTETGLKYFLCECGFPLERIRTGSWGNRACVRANLNLSRWVRFRRYLHSLENEPQFPYSVWALAQKV